MPKVSKFFIFSLLTISFIACSEKKETLFTKISPSDSGIHFNNKIIETDSFNILTSEYIFNGGGVAVGDFNNDGKPDLFFTGNQVNNSLYLNEGDFKFKDISKVANIIANKSWSTGVAVTDINNDGFLDIYVCTAMLPTEKEKQNLLFVNQGLNKNGIPTFKEMASTYGIADAGNSMGATFFDYDKDGHLDLYILNNVDIHVLPANYRSKITDGTALSNDRLYHNNGDGTFTDVTMQAGITTEGYGLGLAIADLNYDGWPDIYVSNDYLTNDLLYINNQDGTFTNQIGSSIKHQSKFSMGNDISDFNNDGYLDIVTLDMLGETNHRLKTMISSNKYSNYVLNEKFGYEYQYSRNMLQKGNGVGIPYSEIGLMAGVSKTDWSWCPLFVDMDNDGYKDLLITNGFPRDITDIDFGEFKFNVSKYLSPAQILDSIPVIKIPNYAYKYKGDNTFEDVGEKWGLNIPSFSNGAVYADLDNDGDLDYVINNINEEAFIFKNNTSEKESADHNFLAVELKGPKNNPAGIGAKIVVRLPDETFQFHEHYLGRGYMSSVEGVAHFGLGTQKNIASIEILWPDGTYEKRNDITANEKIKFSYDAAKNVDALALTFPLVSSKTAALFSEKGTDIGVNFTHEEKDMVDYNVQRILPHKLTQNGPCLAVGDLNGDGTEDFIVGSSSDYSPVIFFQDNQGAFSQKELFTEIVDKHFEEESFALFDLENDGDLDIYMVSGSNEFNKGENYYVDRLFINDGKGNFTLSTDKMPEIRASGSVVKAFDYNGDGFTDLFIGGRTPFAQYPEPENSFLLKNENGTLKDVTDTAAPELRKIGMLTDASWQDVDGDNKADLILIGEFMPITVFKNNTSSFTKLQNSGLDNFLGWWESIEAADFDNDGDIDFIVGNMGSNNFYQPSQERPLTLLSKDFDNNGTVDPIMFAYFKNNFEDTNFESYPVNFWGDLNGQSPLFRKKFNTYKEYSKTTQKTLFTEKELEGTTKLVGNYDKSVYVENNGDGTFSVKELPYQVQIAPIKNMDIADYDNDGNLDVLLVGNDYGNEVFIGRYDAFNGALLKGDGKGNFSYIPTQESGFLVPGDGKDIITVKNAASDNPYIMVSQNRSQLLVFQKK